MRPNTAPLYADFNLIPVLCSVPEIEDFGQYCAVSKRRTREGGLLPAAFRLETGLNSLALNLMISNMEATCRIFSMCG